MNHGCHGATVEMHAAGNRYGSIGRLIVEAQGALGKVDLDVLDRANAAIYWERESRYDTVISLTYGRPALEALGRVIEAWIAHFLGLRVAVKPIRKIDEPRWAWHIGLDAESSALLNELWAGSEVDHGQPDGCASPPQAKRSHLRQAVRDLDGTPGRR